MQTSLWGKFHLPDVKYKGSESKTKFICFHARGKTSKGLFIWYHFDFHTNTSSCGGLHDIDINAIPEEVMPSLDQVIPVLSRVEISFWYWCSRMGSTCVVSSSKPGERHVHVKTRQVKVTQVRTRTSTHFFHMACKKPPSSLPYPPTLSPDHREK